MDKVALSLLPPLTTKKVFRETRKYLRKLDVSSTMRYSLKKGIYALGPTGYPFEKYVARILEADGYSVQVGRLVQGRCVRHEVDVVAQKGRVCYLVECKFHHNGKTRSNVKTALYVHARVMDIAKAGKVCPGTGRTVHRGMLVTNTRFTSEAEKYAQCVGLKVVGWKCPGKGGQSLEAMVQRVGAYPVTVLPAAARAAVLKVLLKHDIVLVSDLSQKSVQEIAALSDLPKNLAARLKSQADSI